MFGSVKSGKSESNSVKNSKENNKPNEFLNQRPSIVQSQAGKSGAEEFNFSQFDDFNKSKMSDSQSVKSQSKKIEQAKESFNFDNFGGQKS